MPTFYCRSSTADQDPAHEVFGTLSTQDQALHHAKPSLNQDWQRRKEQAIARGQGNLLPIFVERASNAEIWDVDGDRYIDFATGIAVCTTGHLHPSVHRAVTRQLDRFSHSCVMVNPYDSAVELAEKLNALAPGDALKKSIFVTTGAEAVENSIKIARAFTGRRAVISFSGGFHGRTYFAMGLTGKMAPYKSGFGPFPSDIFHLPFPNAYHGISVSDSLSALRQLFKTAVDSDDVAAIIVEPVQGEGGFYPAPNEFLVSLRETCNELGIVLIADEIQTGIARTGRMFCCEYSGIEPDIMTVAKGLAGGFPLAAVVGKSDVMDAPLPGGLGGTYAGSPVGCAAALAVLETVEREGLMDRATELARQFKERLLAMQERFPHVVGDIRAERGAMIAVELVQNGDVNQPDAELVGRLVKACADNGLIILSCGVRGNVIRFLPALTISDELVDEGLNVFESSLCRIIEDRH